MQEDFCANHREIMKDQATYKFSRDFVEVFWSKQLIFVVFYEYNLSCDIFEYRPCSAQAAAGENECLVSETGDQPIGISGC